MKPDTIEAVRGNHITALIRLRDLPLAPDPAPLGRLGGQPVHTVAGETCRGASEAAKGCHGIYAVGRLYRLAEGVSMTATGRHSMRGALVESHVKQQQQQSHAMAEPCLCSANIFFASSQLRTLPNPVSKAFNVASCSDCSMLSLPSLSIMTLKFFVKPDLRVADGNSECTPSAEQTVVRARELRTQHHIAVNCCVRRRACGATAIAYPAGHEWRAAHRAVDSQHRFVTTPPTIRVSTSHSRSTDSSRVFWNASYVFFSVMYVSLGWLPRPGTSCHPSVPRLRQVRVLVQGLGPASASLCRSSLTRPLICEHSIACGHYDLWSSATGLAGSMM